MLVQFPKLVIILVSCIYVLPANNVDAGQNRYLSPKDSSRTTALQPGVRTNQRVKKEPYLGSRLIYKTTDSINKSFSKDSKLSLACQRGRFLQKKEMQYIAVVGGRKYGVALNKNSMLHDPKGLGNKDNIYLFKGQGTSNCNVFLNKFDLATIFKN